MPTRLRPNIQESRCLDEDVGVACPPSTDFRCRYDRQKDCHYGGSLEMSDCRMHGQFRRKDSFFGRHPWRRRLKLNSRVTPQCRARWLTGPSEVSQVLDCYACVARLSVLSCLCELGNGFDPLKIRAHRG